MRLTKYIFTGFLGSMLALPCMANETNMIGWIERVKIQNNELMLTAKIDTGADNSSIHAQDVEVYEKHGQQRVKFTVENGKGESSAFDMPVIYMANIKRKMAEPLQRPVVSMHLCIGNTLKKANVNLANRGNFKYRMLIGRSFLNDTYLVHSSKKFTVEPTCKADDLLAMNQGEQQL